MRDLHFDIVDHVDEMKDPRAVGPTDRHVRFHTTIEFDSTADLVVHYDRAPRRSETDRSGILINEAFVLEQLQMVFVDRSALALEIRSKPTAFSGSFVPIQP